MVKSTGLAALMAAMLIVSLGLAGCVGDKSYYARHETSVEELQRTWGYPYEIRPWEDGAEMYIYRTYDQYFNSRFFIIKDGKVLDGGIALQH